jgi:hypothetical protein
MGSNGQLTFTPALARLAPGTVVTFVYNILPIRAGAARSNNATVTITVTDATGPFPPPPSPPLGTGECRLKDRSPASAACCSYCLYGAHMDPIWIPYGAHVEPM